MSDSNEGQLQDYSVDQAAGAIVLVLGAVAGLLQVIWMSKCHCKVNLCYLFRCERKPMTEDEMKSLKKKADELKNKGKKDPPKDPEAPATPNPRSPTAPDVAEADGATASPWRRL
tara:strand:+ start:230 stop:574 length:345 start_codon:yes stop_codon:yes gene_type:complete